MAINVLARKQLWGRAGNRCAWQDCHQRLSVRPGDIEAGVLEQHSVVLGEEAHIRSSRVDGPRHDPDYPAEKLDSYENLILLCPTHHTAIDKESGKGWPTATIVEMKEFHENAVDRQLAPSDKSARAREEALALQLSTWESLLGIDSDANEWENLTFGLNFPIPLLAKWRFERLILLGKWLLSRSWDRELPKLNVAFARHFDVVRTLTSELNRVLDFNNDPLELDRAEKRLDRWDPPEFERRHRKTAVRVATIYYLTSELARSVNLVIEAVRAEVDPLYRFQEGMVLTRNGDGLIVNEIIREEYVNWDWENPPAFPTIKEIQAAIVDQAGQNPFAIQEIDHRALHLESTSSSAGLGPDATSD